MAQDFAEPAYLLRPKQAAAFLGLRNVVTLYRWAAAGKLPRPIKLGRASAWKREDLLAFIAEREKASRGAA